MTRTALVIAILLGLPLTAHAQERPPQDCGMTEEDARYGVEIGAVVTLQRHRFVAGQDNWDDRMTRWLGRSARVTRFGGVDAQGCPGVRVDTDGGQWFWRARDLGIGTGPQPRPAPRAAAAFPQQCHMSRAVYGAAAVGATVVLGQHRPVDGEANWADEMREYVGRTARVTQPADLDGQGCPGVRVDIDGGQWFWRIRDLSAPGTAPRTGADAPYVASTGVAMDHGRPATVAGWGTGGAPGTGGGLFGSLPPQECSMSDANVQWGPIAVGRVVILGQHREVEGDANWSTEMGQWVGQRATITRLVGVDERGCPVVNVDVDGAQYFWRIRDMTVP